jgi:hypothetical protein
MAPLDSDDLRSMTLHPTITPNTVFSYLEVTVKGIEVILYRTLSITVDRLCPPALEVVLNPAI